MKKFLLGISIFCFYVSVFAQNITLTQLPETPLSYLGDELTSPTLKAGYTKRTQYFGTPSASVQIGLILQQKYSDLPIYSSFSELSDFISYVESKTTVTRTAAYVAYLLEARSSSSGTFATYAKDTFFLSGTTITSISETLYDTEDNTVETYAQYDVFYHSNGKINRIELKNPSSDPFYRLSFAGISVVFNANNTVKTDTLYEFGYNGTDTRVNVSGYQDHSYKSASPLKIDSTFANQIGSTPLLNTKLTYTLNTNNEITRAKAYTYSSSSHKYENTFYFDFGQDASLGILSQSNVSTVSLYPNPVQDLVYIPSDCIFQTWSITSVTGLHIKSGTNTDLNKISVADLQAGVYVLTLSNNEQTWTGKFVK
ncbi:T9SS type A sorting domain-containing protein [Cytophaga aurantiaca]|uniref:T9SS type A sorting domain-containing protein n=1 Tax=Cytophaga aurantiaca TaxID=29530 RepID=UPI000379542F|nr:T9SS type A sorting domain-containing protein [Cytophaga aurantiaca]